MKYRCPVCGYRDLPEPPENFSICPSCGTEFGFDDAGVSHAELRYRWMAHFVPWFSRYRPRDPSWDGWQQLAEAGYGQEVIDFLGKFKVSAVSESSVESDTLELVNVA